MALDIETFSNTKGGVSFFKAIGHPLVATNARALVARLAAAGRVGVYDPDGLAAAFGEIHDLSALDIAAVFVQDLDAVGANVLGQAAQPVTDLPAAGLQTLLVMQFDAGRRVDHIRHLLPDGVAVETLDTIRLADDMLTCRDRYLDPLNFATNFAFFRDDDRQHTRLVTANYWSGYGARGTRLWCALFDADGALLADWFAEQPDGVATIRIDSREVRARFGLGPFTGQLFVHVVGGAGHDVVKYALDTYGNDEEWLSCTHDANAWPADRYAGLPAPAEGERVVLWVQNSHPCPIPAGAIGLNRMGGGATAWVDRPVPAFGSVAVDVGELLAGVDWPAQIEITAGKHFVRPRYEVRSRSGRWRISHPNVERSDLVPDLRIPDLGPLLGKGYLLPAPILPLDRYRSFVLPTPMATRQENLPVACVVYDPEGREVTRRHLGCLPRDHAHLLALDDLLPTGRENPLVSGYGHMELIYDFRDGGEADGWLHALFRYEDRASGHGADTSFGAHVFNTVLTYRNEPQSYAGSAPGLSTRLFLRLGEPPHDTMCHLIYPASTAWHPRSQTALLLFDAQGRPVAERSLAIPCGGSRFWRYSETFDADARESAAGGYVIVRDTTCRLFGYHGVVGGANSFSLDHMFGF